MSAAEWQQQAAAAAMLQQQQQQQHMMQSLQNGSTIDAGCPASRPAPPAAAEVAATGLQPGQMMWQQQGPIRAYSAPVGGDLPADAHRQSDQWQGLPAAATAAAAAAAAASAKRQWDGVGASSSMCAMMPGGAAASAIVAAAADTPVKIPAQIDQNINPQQVANTAEPALPPNLKRLRTSACDKLKQSVTPGHDLSFIPTPTWGSPRVSELQPAVVASKCRGSRMSQSGLAAKAAHAASLLAQAAANSAARHEAAAASAAAGAAGGTVDAGACQAEKHAASGSPLGALAAAAGAGAASPGAAKLERSPSGQLGTLIDQQATDNHMTQQFRLELQQLKAEHTALQLLAQQTDQERASLLQGDPPLMTPGVPRSLEADAERLAAKMLARTGGNWKASMAAMMDLLRSNMQQGSTSIRTCSKTCAGGSSKGPAAGNGSRLPATAAAGHCLADSPIEEANMELDAAAVQQSRRAQGEQQEQEPHENAVRHHRPLLGMQRSDSVTHSSPFPDTLPGTAAAAAGSGVALWAPMQAGNAARQSPMCHLPSQMHQFETDVDAAAYAAAGTDGAGAWYEESQPAVGSCQGSPMHPAYAGSGCPSPSLSVGAGNCSRSSSPAVTAAAAARCRAPARQQSRLGPKPAQAAAAAAAAAGGHEGCVAAPGPVTTNADVAATGAALSPDSSNAQEMQAAEGELAAATDVAASSDIAAVAGCDPEDQHVKPAEAAAEQPYPCSAAAAAAAFNAVGAFKLPGPLSVDPECGGLDDDDNWLCAGLLDTPGPLAAAGLKQLPAVDAAEHTLSAQQQQEEALQQHQQMQHQHQQAKMMQQMQQHMHFQQQMQMQQHQMQQQQMQGAQVSGPMLQMQSQQQQMQAAQVSGPMLHVAATAGCWAPYASSSHVTSGGHPGMRPAAAADTGGAFLPSGWQHMHGQPLQGAQVQVTQPATSAAAQTSPATTETALAALFAAAHVHDTQQQQQHQHHLQQPQQMLPVPQQHFNSHSVPSAAPAAPEDMALLQMLLGWSDD